MEFEIEHASHCNKDINCIGSLGEQTYHRLEEGGDTSVVSFSEPRTRRMHYVDSHRRPFVLPGRPIDAHQQAATSTWDKMR
jgi:hypothetical protein